MPATQSIDVPPTADGRLTLTEQELLDRLGWFTHVRWFMAGATLALLPLVIACELLPQPLAYTGAPPPR